MKALLVAANSSYQSWPLAATLDVAAGPAAVTVTTLAAAPKKLPPAAVTHSLPLLLSLLLPLWPLLGILPPLLLSPRDAGGLSFGVLGVGGIAEFLAGKKIVCLSLQTDLWLTQGAFFLRTQKRYPNLCLAQGAIEYGRGSPEFFFPYYFLHSAPLEDTPPAL